MPNYLKIYGAHTLQDGAAICPTCTSYSVARGIGREAHQCSVFGVLSFKVVDCSAYRDARLTSVHEMEETAWRWHGKVDRFVSPAEFYKLEDE